jgi:hypothetical protein
MDRTAIGDFHQPRPRGFGHIALNDDLTGDLADIAVLGVAIRQSSAWILRRDSRIEKRPVSIPLRSA